MGLIFDTSELIQAERRRLPVTAILQNYAVMEDVGISSITIAELQHGLRRAVTPTQHSERKRFLESVQTAFWVYSLDFEIVKRLGDLDAEMSMRGKKIDLADLIVAATALHLDFGVVTSNRKHFEDIPGLQLVSTA